MWSHGKFHWNELMTRDAEAAMAFYRATLGWTFDSMPMPNGAYWVAKLGDDPVAGIFTMGQEQAGIPENWFAYIAVDDLDARLKRATASGGKIVREPFEVPGVGRIAILTDSNGAAVGWITPEEQ
jgi:predicted enzyme related to lactoylglutathione lyase